MRIERTTYDYDATGIRISALNQTDTDANGTWDSTTRTAYLSDPDNHTGYAQTLRESTSDGQGALLKTVDYSFGHDELSQTTREYSAQGAVTSEQTLVFHHDGHGSVRLLTDLAAALQQMTLYDAWGQLLALLNASGQVTSGGGGTAGPANAAQALTSTLYSGEAFDSHIGLQYLRARWYAPLTGRFNRLDDFFGNLHDPQSLHKYAYVHGDPIGGVDPTGREFTIAGMMSSMGIGGALRGADSGKVGFLGVVQGFANFLAVQQAIGAVFTASAILRIRTLSQPIRPIAQAKLQKDFEYARLAQAAYRATSLTDVKALGWLAKSIYDDERTGFRSVLFENQTTQERVMAYAGTDGWNDVLSDIRQAYGSDIQYRQAIDKAKDAMERFGPIDRFVGHSLGGGLATAAALVFNARATTFNAAGVHSQTVQPYGASLGNAANLIDAYRVQGEILSTTQDMSAVWMVTSGIFGAGAFVAGAAGFVAPDSLGTNYWVPAHTFDLLQRHKMEQVILGMQEMMNR